MVLQERPACVEMGKTKKQNGKWVGKRQARGLNQLANETCLPYMDRKTKEKEMTPSATAMSVVQMSC